jgi:stage V sporulation protein B
MVTKRESMLRGTLVITMATLVARLMGAIYKPIVTRMFGWYDGAGGVVGIGMAWVPVTAYQIVLAFASVGFTVAISKLVAERLSLGDEPGARKVFGISIWVMGALGLLGALVFYFQADWLEQAFKTEGTRYGYMAIAPALLLVSLMSAFRGLFQGFQAMTPSAVSQLLEAFTRIVTGLVLVYLLVPHSVPLAAGGFNLGDAAGGLVGLMYLVYLYRKNRQTMWQEGIAAAASAYGHDRRRQPAARQTTRQIVKAILRIGLPLALIGAAQPIMSQADIVTLGFSYPDDELVMGVYGQLTNGLMVIMLPTVFTLGLYTSLVPTISEAMAVGRQEQARSQTALAYRMTMLVAFPAAAGLVALGIPIYHLIYGSAAPGGELLVILGLGTLPTMLQQTSSGILQGMGRIAPPVVNLLAGTAIKLALNLVLVPLIGPSGAAWATVIGFTVAAGLNLLSVYKHMGAGMDWVGGVLKPGLAAGLMGLAVWAVDLLVRPWFGPGWGKNALLTLLLIGLGGVAYLGALVLVRGVPRADLERIPRVGRKLADLLARLRLLPR